MKRNRLNRWRYAAALFLTIVLAGVWAPTPSRAETAAQVDEVRQILEDYHLSKPDDQTLNEAAIQAMVDTLHDPYTEYFNAEQWKSFESGLEQTFTGIGIMMVEEDGIVYVEDVVPGGPADTAGVIPGDVLASVDGKSLKGLSVPEIQKIMKGNEGSTVTLGVARDGQTLSFRMIRKAIQLPVATGKMMGDGVGYLALSGFTSDAGKLFAKQLDSLESAGMKSLVIDLRDNGGGYINAARDIAALFIKDGVLAHLKDREGKDNPIEVSGGGKDYPVTLLVNGNSASASELLAGALEDYGIAKLVGTRTYGKGVVQSIIPLESGGVIKVTVQEYFTPKGRKVDHAGLTPELVVDGAAEQLIEAFRNAGGGDMTLSFGKGAVVINGVRVARPNAADLRGQDRFVNLRLAAAVAGAQVNYDKKTKTVTLSRDGVVYKLKSGDSRMMNKNGWSLIELRTLVQWFPGLSSDTSGGELTLTVR